MKHIVLLALFLGFVPIAIAQGISKNDSIQIVEKVADWNNAWKIKDVNLATKWYTDDAEFTNAFGFSMIGNTAINKYLSKVFKMDFVMAGNSEQTSIKLKPISKNAILVISTISRKGQKTNTNEELGTRRTTHHRLFKKIDDDWKIIAHLISDARSIDSKEH